MRIWKTTSASSTSAWRSAEERRETAEAEQQFRRALYIAPGDDRTHFYYAEWLLTQGAALKKPRRRVRLRWS
jgi:hypothetical protein